jgi:predicted Zn-dependent peptidase
MAKLPYQIITFKNGFKAILYPKKGLYSVALNLYIQAGHIYEDDKSLGLSHFAEHMIFKGTNTHPTPQILNKYQDEIAFHPSAYTSVDHVSVYGVAPRANLNLSLEHLTRLVNDSLFKTEDIEKERSVISEEFLRRRDNPEVYLWDESMKRRFKGSTAVVGRPVSETVENVQKAPVETIKEFYKTFYVPSRMVFGIAGDINISEVTDYLEKHFSSSQTTDSKYQPTLNIKDVTHKSTMKISGDYQKIYLKISWPTYENLADLKTVLSINLLNSILNRRIWEILREDLGVVYDFSIGNFGALNDVSILIFHTSFEKSKMDLVIQVINSEIKKLLEQGISSTELKQHVRRMNQTTPMSFDYLTSALSWILSDLYFNDRISLPDECIKARNKITPKELLTIAQTIFKPEFMHISAIGPITQKELEKSTDVLLK